MKKITILALHLGYGGIEKCISSLANSLVSKYKVEILCTYKIYDKLVYNIDDNVKITFLTNVIPNRNEFKVAIKHKNIYMILKEGIKAIKILRLKKKVNIDAIKNCKSDIIISTRDYFNFLLGKYGTKTKIAWEHNHHHNNKKYIRNLTKSVKNIDKLILVSKDLTNFYTNYFEKKHINCKCIYIPNFLDEIPKKNSKLDNNNLISVGRLSPEKKMGDLIDVYNLVNKSKKDTHLDLVGDGVENVKLHGYKGKDYINKLYANSSLYIMTSKTESFGLVLIEAMSYKIPCIAFSDAEGANEIIENGYNGYLIKNRDQLEMKKKIIELLNNRDELKRLGTNAKITAQKYSKDVIIKEWNKVL